MRSSVIIAVICLALIALGAWMYYHSGPNQTPALVQAENAANANAAIAQETDVAFTPIASGTSAIGMPDRKNYAIYDAAEFVTFWKKAKGDASTPPKVDFKKSYVIAAFAGAKSTGGYNISIESVKDSATARNVEVLITEPGKDCVVTQAKTSPYVFITVPLDGAESLAHTDTVQTKECK